MVFSAHEFRQWLATGHRFARVVHGTARLCYDAGNMVMEPIELSEADLQAIARACEQNVQIHRQRASQFLEAAESQVSRGQHAITLFSLHQATEQALLAIIRHGTGLRANTHNIDKLWRYAKLFAAPGPDLFPRDTAAEQELFDTLQKAYVDSRYSRDYRPSAAIAATLLARVQQLLATATTLTSA
jgi:HEPN domain-containing protein